MPAAFKEGGLWKNAEPGHVDRNQHWWEVYGDTTLDSLVAQADEANQNIQLAEAQYRQALAFAGVARAALWPSLGVNAGASRGRTNTNGTIRTADDYSVGLQASWEVDLWGGLRRSAEAGRTAMEAGAADLAAMRLSIEATLVQDYIQLHVIDAQKALFARTVEGYAHSLKLVRSQYEQGVALRSDLGIAESQLTAAQAQAIDLDAQRSQLEHAIAVLVGKPPASFSLPSMADQPELRIPDIPPALPSQLLERRPDIAGAERRVAAANANIGVAKAAYFPSLTLKGSAGYNNPTVAQLFDTPARVWSVGAQLAETLFDGGLRRARSDEAIAAYDAAAAQYKQTVLAGFQEVEDNLSLLQILGQEIAAQDLAVRSSQRAEHSALSQYQAGAATYLNVVTAQALVLNNERTAVQLRGRRLLASAALIKALGGGWQGIRAEEQHRANGSEGR